MARYMILQDSAQDNNTTNLSRRYPEDNLKILELLLLYILITCVHACEKTRIKKTTKKNKNNYKGNYIRVDTDFILKDNSRQLRRQL